MRFKPYLTSPKRGGTLRLTEYLKFLFSPSQGELEGVIYE